MATDTDGETDWRDALLAHRERKDEYFGDDAHSPIPPEERDEFDGLDYFPPEDEYRFVLPLHEHQEKEPVTVATSTEGERTYLRWGEFRFSVDGQDVTIQAYKAHPEEDRLWVPFRDETSGDETYGTGRYLDLEPEAHRVGERRDGGDDEWVLDFNQAYNPTCAYDDRYECPLPPMENWLDVPIEAGERSYH